MKRFFLIPALAASLFLPSCAGVFTNVITPVTATNVPSGPRVGKSSFINIMGVVAVGDSSIERAKQRGGITVVSSVDVQTFSVLGVFNRSTTIVRGR